jgi:hypothetical protein
VTAFELATAIAVGVLALWFILRPLGRQRAAVHPMVDPIPLEETARGQALAALSDLEFDHATGKISEQDYAAQRPRRLAEALARLGPDPATASGSVACPSCGPRPEIGARFCSTCGQPLGA